MSNSLSLSLSLSVAHLWGRGREARNARLPTPLPVQLLSTPRFQPPSHHKTRSHTPSSAPMGSSSSLSTALHTRKQTHTHTYMDACFHSQSKNCLTVYAQTYTLIYTPTQVITHSLRNFLPVTHTLVLTYTHTHTHMAIHTHGHTHSHTHTGVGN